MHPVMKITIPKTYLKITGSRADMLRDFLARNAVAKEKDGGEYRAGMLLAADKYIIKMEQNESGLRYSVGFDHEGDSFVAIGPNLAKQLVSEAVPLLAIGGSEHRMAYTE